MVRMNMEGKLAFGEYQRMKQGDLANTEVGRGCQQ